MKKLLILSAFALVAGAQLDANRGGSCSSCVKPACAPRATSGGMAIVKVEEAKLSDTGNECNSIVTPGRDCVTIPGRCESEYTVQPPCVTCKVPACPDVTCPACPPCICKECPVVTCEAKLIESCPVKACQVCSMNPCKCRKTGRFTHANSYEVAPAASDRDVSVEVFDATPEANRVTAGANRRANRRMVVSQ